MSEGERRFLSSSLHLFQSMEVSHLFSFIYSHVLTFRFGSAPSPAPTRGTQQGREQLVKTAAFHLEAFKKEKGKKRVS